MNTENQYWQIINNCKNIYTKKIIDYGTSWRVLRPIALADQMYIKAIRIRQFQESGVQKINENISGEWQAIVNYGIIACIQLELQNNEDWEMVPTTALEMYEKNIEKIFALMQNKNHDYGEAWRSMSQESFVDLILTKLLRIKQIIANQGKTEISEGIDANFHDIVNYAVFALILSNA